MKISAVFEKKFREQSDMRVAAALAEFGNEAEILKRQQQTLSHDYKSASRLNLKLQAILVRQEELLERMKLGLVASNIENVYQTFGLSIPNKVKVAMYLIK